MKLGQLNVGPDQLSRIEIGEEPGNIKDVQLDAQLFKIRMVDDYYEKIIQFFMIGKAPEDYTMSYKKPLFVIALYFQLIVGQLYKTRSDEILC